MSAPALGPAEVVAVMSSFRDGLDAHRATLNRLNVYPVPDGDTGTNMLLTAQAVVDALDALDLPAPGASEASSERTDGAGGEVIASGAGEAEMAAVCAAIAHGSLMGARGNSGVILCQILRGMTTSFSGAGKVEASDLVEAFEAASREARAAVLRPAEGTILTVAAGAAEGARAALGADPEAVLVGARQGSISALWRTPELLPVLAEAGVVDAGGAGLVLLYDAFLHVVNGRPLPSVLELPEQVLETIGSGALGDTPGDLPFGGEPLGDASPSLRYEVMYFLDAPDEAMPVFKQVWAGIGDSIVVVGGDGLWNCHVHTDDIGAAIEAALDVGRPRDIRVSDLAEQVEEEQWVRQAVGGATGDLAMAGPAPGATIPRTSVVAVATGDGVSRIFRSLGVSGVVAGGQSMNPSTAELLAAVEATAGQEVVILPNNSNILPVADQAALLADKPVRVVPTMGIQEGFAALLEYDPQCSSEENATEMGAAASRVVAGEVTRAVRAADTAAGQVQVGDWIGLSRTGVEVVAASLEDATCALLERLLGPDHEIVTLIEGAGSSPAETRKVTEWLRAKHPDLVVERHAGGQPLYPFLLSIE